MLDCRIYSICLKTDLLAKVAQFVAPIYTRPFNAASDDICTKDSRGISSYNDRIDFNLEPTKCLLLI